MLRPEWPALGSVQYTIQKFYRVNGGSTQRKGVTPDIIMPTGNEETETGEKFEDNALPWDSIDAATYVKSGDLTAFGPELLKEHNARIAKDPEFQNIMKDIARFNAMKDKRNIVSLNYAVREKENNEDDATRLARLNERFKREENYDANRALPANEPGRNGRFRAGTEPDRDTVEQRSGADDHGLAVRFWWFLRFASDVQMDGITICWRGSDRATA
uniref:Tail specific protease C-terminal domain-containing protein n=1 Tax=Panagrolaimus superbus TaxID=310955 RepID=A0A914YGG2_9BILA